jgi:chromosomal replication initiator protein
MKKLIAEKVLDDREISIETAKCILSDYIRASSSTAPTIDKIKKSVAHFYGIKLSDLTSANRVRAIARPRQIAMYLAKTITSESLPNIGKEFGGKNHATVIHSVKIVNQLMNSSPTILAEVKGLEEKIRS